MPNPSLSAMSCLSPPTALCPILLELSPQLSREALTDDLAGLDAAMQIAPGRGARQDVANKWVDDLAIRLGNEFYVPKMN